MLAGIEAAGLHAYSGFGLDPGATCLICISAYANGPASISYYSLPVVLTVEFLLISRDAKGKGITSRLKSFPPAE